MNTKQVKKLINTFIGLLLIVLLGMLFIDLFSKPNIQDIKFTNLDKIKIIELIVQTKRLK
jgi:hypothetical protein